MRRLVQFLEFCVIALMGFITILVISEVAMRTFFHSSLIVTEELSRYLMVWTAMLAGALLVHEDGHIRVGLVADSIGEGRRMIVFVLAQLVTLAFLALLVTSSVMKLPDVANQGTITLDVSMMWFYLAMPVGGLLMMLLLVNRTVQRVLEYRRGSANAGGTKH